MTRSSFYSLGVLAAVLAVAVGTVVVRQTVLTAQTIVPYRLIDDHASGWSDSPAGSWGQYATVSPDVTIGSNEARAQKTAVVGYANAQYLFSGAQVGVQSVWVSWPSKGMKGQLGVTTYTVFYNALNGPAFSQVNVDQRIDPTDGEFRGVSFKKIATIDARGGTIKILVSNGITGTWFVTDAVALTLDATSSSSSTGSGSSRSSVSSGTGSSRSSVSSGTGSSRSSRSSVSSGTGSSRSSSARSSSSSLAPAWCSVCTDIGVALNGQGQTTIRFGYSQSMIATVTNYSTVPASDTVVRYVLPTAQFRFFGDSSCRTSPTNSQEILCSIGVIPPMASKTLSLMISYSGLPKAPNLLTSHSVSVSTRDCDNNPVNNASNVVPKTLMP